VINPLNIRSDAANKSRNLRKSAAKVQQFFELCKYFYKKNQKNAFLYDLFGILVHYACIKWGNYA